jgi:ATP-dependent RNA helicase RhlE
LALQIVDDLIGLAWNTGIRAAAVYGGVGMGPQEKAFRKGVDVIVATPGRLLDHFTRDYAALAGLEYLVLDEADRMLDMGFLPDIRRVLQHVPTPRQTLFFSATMPPPIEKLARELLRDPVKIALQRKAAPAQGVSQTLYPVPSALKGALLVDLIKRGPIDDALVFTRTKHRADRLTKQLKKQGITAERIHGNRSQAQRTRALAGFKTGKHQILVATDIAARGIDVEGLGHVVNFDVPTVPDDYIHRVGRTARADATGDAFTLVSPENEADVTRIERALGTKIPRVRFEGFCYTATRGLAEEKRGDRAARSRSKNAAPRSQSQAGQSGDDGRTGPRRRPFGRRRR